jgi:hypothetical protein
METLSNEPQSHGQGFDVFISYSSANKLAADAMKQYLQAKGIRCWKAPDDIVHGESWARAIPRAIRMARVMVVIWTKESMRSEQVINELTLADRSKKLVIPFRTESIEPENEFEYYLAKTHWLDAFSDDLAESFQLLADRILLNLAASPGCDANDVESPGVTSGKSLTFDNEVSALNEGATFKESDSWTGIEAELPICSSSVSDHSVSGENGSGPVESTMKDGTTVSSASSERASDYSIATSHEIESLKLQAPSSGDSQGVNAESDAASSVLGCISVVFGGVILIFGVKLALGGFIYVFKKGLGY